MNKTKKILLILLSVILCLNMLTACQPKTSSDPDTDIIETEESNTKPGEETKIDKESPENVESAEEAKGTEEKNSSDAPVTAPAETSQNVTKEPSKTEQNDEALLQMEGSAINNQVTLSLEDLKSMKEAHFEDDFFSLNSYGTKKYFHFKGVKIKAILDKAGLKSNAKNIKFVATDGYTQELTIDQALREDYIDEQDPSKKYPVIIAWHEDGKDYDAKKGPPFRLVIGQEEPDDMNKVKWVMNIAKIIVN